MTEQESEINPEKIVLSYLYQFGSTRENDLLSLIVRECGFSKRGSKKALDRLEKNKKIYRIVHEKLRPPGVYFRIEKYTPTEIKKEWIRQNAEIIKNSDASLLLLDLIYLDNFIKSHPHASKNEIREFLATVDMKAINKLREELMNE